MSDDTDAYERETMAEKMGFQPEEEITDEQDYAFRGVQSDMAGGGKERQLEHDFIKPKNRVVNARLSRDQAIAIPKLRQFVRLWPEFSEEDEMIAEKLIDDHMDTTVSMHGEGREEAVSIIQRVRQKLGDSDGSNVALKLMGADTEEDD